MSLLVESLWQWQESWIVEDDVFDHKHSDEPPNEAYDGSKWGSTKEGQHSEKILY